MWSILRKNFKELYLFSFILTIIDISLKHINGILTEFSKYNNIDGKFYCIFITCLILNIIYIVYETGWNWYILRLYRDNKNSKMGFIQAFKSMGWVLILYIVKVIVFTIICIFTRYTAILVGQIGGDNVTTVLTNLFACMVNVLFVFVPLIYYDNKERGPLLAVFDSMTSIQNCYFKVFLPYLIIIISVFISVIGSFVGGYNLIFEIIRIVWLVIFSPVYTLKICEIYDKVKIKNTEINDSLTTVARALDENGDKY